MNIAISTIYGEQYKKDRLFDETFCKIGEHLLLPYIMLKKTLEKSGHVCHTADFYRLKNIDIILFMDIPSDSLLTVNGMKSFVKYILKAKWKSDYLLKAIITLKKNQRILQINEPPTVAPISYQRRLHRYFKYVITWNDDLIDEVKYIKFFIPQYCQIKHYENAFLQKKLVTMIAGNKKSVHKKELYSARRQVIDFFEEVSDDFDLYGFGWENEHINNYKGTVEKKIETLSKYRFCICFENIYGINGYITEKLFDCFFAQCIPVYWGAENVLNYIPAEAFIDMRQFKSVKEMYYFIRSIDESTYISYIKHAQDYINSDQFLKTFSANSYVEKMSKLITEN